MSSRLIAAAMVLTPLLAITSLQGGGWLTVHAALADAATLADRGDDAGAYGIYAAVAARSGPQYALAHRDVVAAGNAAVATLERWADQLAAQQRTEDAVALLDRVPADHRDPGVRDHRARLLLDGAQAALSAGQPELALQRLASLLAGNPPAGSAVPVAELQRSSEVAAAARLLDVLHRPAEAVLALDLATQGARPGDTTAAQAAALLPSALLATGQACATAAADREAVAVLQRLLASYPGTPEAAQASTLLAAPQAVSGTVVLRDGTPITGRVRLSAHFVKLASGYRTTGPYYPGSSDAGGNFTLTGIPQGSGYVLEVLLGGGWTTLVDGDLPAMPVTVGPLPTDMSYVVMPG